MNRNYLTPTIDPQWADSRNTDLEVAIAIHAIADPDRSANDIWEAPTNAEWDHVIMAITEYVAHGDTDQREFNWGQESFNID